MELTPIDEQSLVRLTDAQLNELVLAHEAVFRGRCRDNITTFAKSVEIPGAPPALTQEQKVWLADRKTRLDRTIKEVEDEVFDGDEAPLYGSKVDVGLHHEMILEAIKSTVEEVPVFGSMANGMDGVAPDGVMIFAPPGCAKSTYASVAAPAYLLGLYQDFDIISASYASELAKRFGRRVRHMCRSKDFQDIFETELREDNQAVDQWSLKNNSSYRAVGIMGGITGFRANLFIIDDPVAGREEADSEIIREKTWQAYKDDITTRLKPGGKLCIIQTRWHQDDLSGRILGPNWDGQSGLWEGTDGRIWLVLCLPLVAERADDPLGRRAGEILWHRKDDGTGWFTDRHVELAKAAGERSWNSLQQQRPTAAEGNIIRRDLWKCWPHGNPEPTAEQLANPHAVKPPDVLAVFLTYDTAFEDKEDNDDSAMCAWGYFEKTINVSHRKDEQVKHRHIILLGAWKDKVDAIDLVEVVKSHVKHFEPEVLCVEKRASGIQLVQELRRLRPRHKRGHVIVETWLPKGVPGTKGKRARAFAAALVMAEGVIWYMPGPKTQEVRKQCAAFRTGDDGTPDDWTDCCTMAIARSRDGFQLDLSTDELDEQEDRDKKAQDIKDGGRRRGYGSMGGEKQPLEKDEDRADGGEVKRRLYGRR